MSLEKKLNLIMGTTDPLCTHDKTKSIHYAGCFKGSKLISRGFNHERTLVGGRIVGCSCHAEVHAINNLLKVA